ncbi:hypothetical protein [Dyadobacter sp. CY323]|uniref:hypothetical protein n=1 Tax=Dyadobacter sp. CY323 TaxID=2907302 RepID=UPI001F1A794C|nr:hypothetical protein [Dyadobacter sp. CY323]MCE6992285.1 hypothetical protein [Dyadobacter sp. CY323]
MIKDIVKATIILVILAQVLSCYNFKEVSCEEAADGVRLDSCNVVVSEFSKNEYKFYLHGIIPGTNTASTFKKTNYTWGYWFVDKIAKGDTVVKKGGELLFYIYKKDTVLVFPFECDGKIYE